LSTPLVVTVLLFGPAREAVGRSRTVMELPTPVTAAKVVDALSTAHPNLAPLLDRSRLVVNRRYVDGDASVGPDDEVAIIPPVSGG
jgi:molybdopterin converting factor small subunit